jgi:membrane-associated protein
MGQAILDVLRGYLAQYGYWAVGATLLLENAGVPVPGETILLLASFLAFSEQELRLPYIIVVGVCAAVLGDNLGFALGYRGGRALFERYLHIFPWFRPAVARGERLFEQYGSVTIFFARFLFGLRVLAGPLAGVLRMSWKKFALFNVLGALVWVTVISAIGYFFGEHWDQLLHYVKRLNLIVAILVLAFVVWSWWRRLKRAS